MQFVNAALFTPPALAQTFLAARGFDRHGARSGGIVNPVKVDLMPGQVVIRFFQHQGDRLGQWWTTPHELALIFVHFGVDGPAFDAGRAAGRGILQGALGVRPEWGNVGANRQVHSPFHMRRFWTARVVQPLHAFYGDGDAAPSANQQQVLKPVQIEVNGIRRPSRQLFLPRIGDYASALQPIGDGFSASDLRNTVRGYKNVRLPFER